MNKENKLYYIIFCIHLLILTITSTPAQNLMTIHNVINKVNNPHKGIDLTGANKHYNTLSDSNITLVGRWANGPCQAVTINGNYAYYGNGAYLEIADISDPSNPVEVGKVVLPSLVDVIKVSSNYAYVSCTDNGMRIVDISNPTNPNEVGFFNAGSYIVDLAINGSYVYLANWSNGLKIIDISSPSTPVEIGFIDTGNRTNGVTVSENFAYVTNFYGLSIVDISNPTSPIQTAYLNIGVGIENVTVFNNYAYIAGGGYGLRIIDITNPSNPFEVGFFNAGGVTSSVTVRGDYAYVATNGMRIINISNPSVPFEVGFFNSGFDAARQITLNDNYAYIAAWYDGLRILNVANPSAPFEVSSIFTGGESIDVKVNGNYAYVSSAGRGLRILNISDLSDVYEVGSFVSLGSIYEVVVKGDYAYVADFRGLKILDISNPSSPLLIGSYIKDFVYGVTLRGNYAYLADWYDGLRIVDISDPTLPFEVGYFDTGDLAVRVDVCGNYAYVADWYDGLRIVDISDPTLPFEVGYFDTGDQAHTVDVQGNYAYIADGIFGLRIVDVSNPTLPVEIGFWDVDTVVTVDVAGNFAYVGIKEDGIVVLDINNPSIPVAVGSFETSEIPRDIEIGENYVFIADAYVGVYIVEPDPSIFPDLPDFSANLFISDICFNGQNLNFGTAPDATNGFDSLYDCYGPPPPPSGVFGGWFESLNEILFCDFKETILDSIRVWDVHFQPANGCYPVNFSWNPNEFPRDGNFHLTDTINGGQVFIDMRTNNSFILTDTSITSLKIEYSILDSIPVELTSFTGISKDNYVELYWITATELNNSGFSIERKIKTEKHWEQIAFLEGKGTTTEKTNYSYIDKNLKTATYSYRLKQIDFNGGYEYSKTIEVEVSVPKQFSLDQNYPNPFNPSTTISYSLPTTSRVQLKIFNILGKEIETLVNEEKPAGTYEITWNATALSSGIYFYRIQAGNYTESKKLVLVR